MALQDKVGLEKLVYKATAGDITIDAQNLDTDVDALIEKLTRSTARGTDKRTGNKRIEMELGTDDLDNKAAIEADEGNLNDLEAWQLGSTSADETFPDLDLIWEDRFIADPESEEWPAQIRFKRVWNG